MAASFFRPYFAPCPFTGGTWGESGGNLRAQRPTQRFVSFVSDVVAHSFAAEHRRSFAIVRFV